MKTQDFHHDTPALELFSVDFGYIRIILIVIARSCKLKSYLRIFNFSMFDF